MGYDSAKAAFAAWGVDTEAAIERLKTVPISMHCWQGDDVVGFETQTGSSGGGIQATGNHPGRARTPDELRADLEFAYSMIPRSAPAEPSRHVHGHGGDTRPRRDRVQALRAMGGLGQSARHRPRL